MKEVDKPRNAFDLLWHGWLRNPDIIQDEVNHHLQTRQCFISFIVACLQAAREPAEAALPNVLEVGCGTAIDSFCLAEKLPGRFYATDVSIGALKVAGTIGRKLGGSIRRVAADLNCLSFGDESFDLVFSQGVLEHFRDPDPVMAEQVRVTKKGGLLIVDVPQTLNPYTLYKKYKLSRGNWPYGWETQYTAWELKKLGLRHGLTTWRVGSWGDTWGFAFSRRWVIGSLLNKAPSVYFQVMNRFFRRFAPYYRQCVSACFIRPSTIDDARARHVSRI